MRSCKWNNHSSALPLPSLDVKTFQTLKHFPLEHELYWFNRDVPHLLLANATFLDATTISSYSTLATFAKAYYLVSGLICWSLKKSQWWAWWPGSGSVCCWAILSCGGSASHHHADLFTPNVHFKDDTLPFSPPQKSGATLTPGREAVDSTHPSNKSNTCHVPGTKIKDEATKICAFKSLNLTGLGENKSI